MMVWPTLMMLRDISVQETTRRWIEKFYSFTYDEKKISELIYFHYEQENLKKPQVIIVDSPISAMIIASILCSKSLLLL